MDLTINTETTISLPVDHVLTVTAPAGGAGSVTRLGAKAGEADIGTTAISESTTTEFGPYGEVAWFRIRCTAGALTYASARVSMADYVGGAISDTFANLPTADPEVLGAPWNSSGTVTISEGPAE